tara:strand:+ start:675 stop:1073 length:399 start_codon:yes stop_codon:yes gene_type:complete
MQNYVFYKTSDGTITMQKEYSNSSSAEKTCSLNVGLACIVGRVPDVNAYKVDLSDLSIVPSTATQFKPTIETILRHKRNTLLKACDWTVGADSPLSDSKKTEWQTYRQALRDLPTISTATTQRDIAWPTKPE